MLYTILDMTEYVSLKANRRDMWFDIPRYSELQQKIKEIDNNKTPAYQTFRHKDQHKALLACFMLTGARVSEVIELRRRNVAFFDRDGKELNNFNGPLKCMDVESIVFTMRNEKSKSKPIKTIPVQRYPMWSDAMDWIVKHVDRVEARADTKLFKRMTRFTCWRLFKAVFGKNYFPHIMRHYVTSNDTRAGINAMVIKQKLGWSSLRMHDVYAHMNTDDIKNEMLRVYGVTPGQKVALNIQAGIGGGFGKVIAQLDKDKRQLGTQKAVIIKKATIEAQRKHAILVEDELLTV